MKEKFNQIKYQNKYNKENYERINLNFKIGEKEKFKQQAIKRGYKEKEFSKYVRDLIYRDIEEGGGGVLIKREIPNGKFCTKPKFLYLPAA
ncbi:MAG: antitoxin [Inoviridae sp.]|nr:MAG: antitoxin [Inoviridae sp.]